MKKSTFLDLVQKALQIGEDPRSFDSTLWRFELLDMISLRSEQSSCFFYYKRNIERSVGRFATFGVDPSSRNPWRAVSDVARSFKVWNLLLSTAGNVDRSISAILSPCSPERRIQFFRSFAVTKRCEKLEQRVRAELEEGQRQDVGWTFCSRTFRRKYPQQTAPNHNEASQRGKELLGPTSATSGPSMNPSRRFSDRHRAHCSSFWPNTACVWFIRDICGNNNDFLSSVAIGKPERNVRKASHCGSKQQQSSSDEITLLLLVRATYTVYGCYSSRTFRSWWIAHSTQLRRRSLNTGLM